MHPGLHTCRSDATLGQVASMLTQNHVHALVVVDQEQIIHRESSSDYDLLAGEWLSRNHKVWLLCVSLLQVSLCPPRLKLLKRMRL